ncbi:protein RST1 isoform X1 [Apium graveolens]|uniref:protein RST1 isoform X1 n=1 Tax=Apium graveolens TaxID=4045 RepID=UPI003D79C254
MESSSYSSLLEKTGVPQPSIQSYAVISIFDKFRSSPDDNVGRDAITHCLLSSSPPVVDQSVRQLCLVVTQHHFPLSHALVDLQSALEQQQQQQHHPPPFVVVFVKALGFLVRWGFRNHPLSFRFSDSHSHPFVKILSCRIEVQSQLVEQVILFMLFNKNLGMLPVCEFLSPFFNFITITMSNFIPFSRTLFSSIASLCCSYPVEALPVIKLLIRLLRFSPCNNEQEISNVSYFLELMVDMLIVVLRQLAGIGLMVHEVQLQCVELLETIFSLNTYLDKGSCRSDAVIEISRRLVAVQNELGLSYIPEISSVVLSLFITLVQAEFEHKQLSILRMLLLLVKWKGKKGNLVAGCLGEELLFIFPLMNFMSSPSKSVKQAATKLLSLLFESSRNLLITQAEGQDMKKRTPSISRPEHIFYRLLQHLWYQDPLSSYSSSYLVMMNGDLPKKWTNMIVEYALGVVERQKSSVPISQPENIVLKEMAPYISAIMSVLVLHHALGASAVELLAVTGNMNPKLGVPLLLVILFYNNIICAEDQAIDYHWMLQLKLLGVLPSLASHPAMVPLVVQTILPMLQNDTTPMLYATATRVLCKTWEMNDRVFGSLQSVLLPKRFIQYASERDICISMAISLRDICKKDPDRGVDLILSVSACIESCDPSIHTIGLLSLAHLCEADVIDFYTAWGVIQKHLLSYMENPVICHGMSLLLRCGAMDAAAFPEAANGVLYILWEIGATTHPACELMWTKARATAFESLTHFEVLLIQNSIPEFKDRNMELLTAETHTEVLRAMEKFEINIVKFEHQTRQRLVKEKRIPRNKIEKLVRVYPQLNFNQGDNRKTRDLPGAALFCLNFTHDVNNLGPEKDLHARFRTALLDIAGSLQLSRNILVAVLSFQSWKAFMQRWIKAQMEISTAFDNTDELANDILKSIIKIAEETIPRLAENIALAVGAFCMVLPPSAHAVKSSAIKFLLNWLFQYEHEYRQWSAAISIGVISSNLHATDYKQKIQNVNALLEVAAICKSTLVKGACGLGLGFSSQDLFTRVRVDDESDSHKEAYRKQETYMLGRIMRALCQMLSKIRSPDALELQSLSACFGQATDAVDSESLFIIHDNLEEDVWGIAGVVLGLGSTVAAVYRTGNDDAVHKINSLLKSWIHHVNPLKKKSATTDKIEIALSVGSCLALPNLVDFFQKVDKLEDFELDNLINGLRGLISELVSVNKSGALHQSLLFASCTALGNLLACILNEGVHSVQVEYVNEFLILLKKCYTSSHSPLVHLGGMLGIVNMLGAGAGSLFQHDSPTILHPVPDSKQSSFIMGPLLSSSAMEPKLMSLIQDIFLVAQNPDDYQLQPYAAWAISFLRHCLRFTNVRNEENNSQCDVVGSKFVSSNFSDNSLVMKLSLWLSNHNFSGTGTAPHVNTVATALRCLTSAPRLPLLDWGAIIRRCVRYNPEDHVLLPSDSASLGRGFLQEECLLFSLAHAKEFDSLLNFLDELCDLPRFRTLKLNMQSCVLSHLADMIKVFSGSRIEKLFDDVAEFVKQLVPSDQLYNLKQKSLLRISFWKGLSLCLNGSTTDEKGYVSYVENCMKVLFSSTSSSSYSATSACHGHLLDEWTVAIRCLAQARKAWLVDFLKVSELDFRPGNIYFLEVKKKIQATCRLVGIGSIPLTHVGKLKASMLNTRSQDIWEVLVEVAATLQHADGSTKRQWVLDAAEISCVTSHPLTALQFLGLLCGSFSKYMPFLIVDQLAVLSDFPIALASLLSETSWRDVADSVVSLLWTTTKRVHDWVTNRKRVPNDSPNSEDIDQSEDSMAGYLLNLLHHACVLLKDYLPTEKQLSLANMVIP